MLKVSAYFIVTTSEKCIQIIRFHSYNFIRIISLEIILLFLLKRYHQKQKYLN